MKNKAKVQILEGWIRPQSMGVPIRGPERFESPYGSGPFGTDLPSEDRLG